MEELETLEETSCQVRVRGGREAEAGKVNVLLQAYVSRAAVETHSLVSDQAFVAQNVVRIARAMFEISLTHGWPRITGRVLEFAKNLEHRLWFPQETPLRQFLGLSARAQGGQHAPGPGVPQAAIAEQVLRKLESNRLLSADRVVDMDPKVGIWRASFITLLCYLHFLIAFRDS